MLDWRVAVLAVLVAAFLGMMLGESREHRLMMFWVEKEQEFANFWQQRFCEVLEKLPSAVRRGEE